jgi:type I restriction enzyme S subunit
LATGGTPSRTKPEYFGGEIKWLVSGDIHQGEIYDCEGRITEAGMRNSNAKFLPVDSVMIALNGQGKTRGTVAMLRTKATCNQSMVSIFPRESSGLLPEFLYANLQGRYEEIRRMTSDDDKDRRGLNMGLIRDIEITIAPLPEQHRIVVILDEAFDGIATAKANAEKNLQNARALFESHLQSVFTERGEGWVEKRLGDIAEVQSGGTPTVSKKEFWNGDIPWYSSGELNRTFTTNPERHITDVGLENSNAKLFPKGALLVGMYDTAALKMSILDRDGAFNQAIAGIKPNDRIDVEFILHAINVEKPRLLLERRGVRQKNLSLGKIKEISVPLPAPEVQRDVVARLRQFAIGTQRLESLYQQKLTALDDLKKSLLHQASSGQL